MYRKVLVPLDGSPFAEQALPLAAALARRLGAGLRLLYVHDPSSGEPRDAATRQEEGYLAEVARRVEAEAAGRVSSAWRSGRAHEALQRYIATEGIDLVVMTTRGWGGPALDGLGSVAEATLRSSEVPVVLSRPTEDGAPRPDGTAVEHVLVPLDGSELAEAILEHAATVGGADARYSLVRVVPAPIPWDPTAVSFGWSLDEAELEALRAEALDYLERLADTLAGRVRRVDTVVLLEPEPAGSILDFADRNDVDLVALATHGRGGLRRHALGSVAEKVLRGLTVPVLVFRPPMA
jgi:nucleotide-binding universal stress UspA family protein